MVIFFSCYFHKMGEVELDTFQKRLIIRSDFFFYGEAANPELAIQIAADIENHWNEPRGQVKWKSDVYEVIFDIDGFYEPALEPETIWYNTNARFQFFRIEEWSPVHISFVDGLGCNTGFFKLDNLLQTSTTAAHEYGHTLGLIHPKKLDIRGKGAPGIMFPRGTLCDAEFQYDPSIPVGEKGGTLDPRHRRVLQEDIDALQLQKLRFEEKPFTILGTFSSIYHSKYTPTEESD